MSNGLEHNDVIANANQEESETRPSKDAHDRSSPAPSTNPVEEGAEHSLESLTIPTVTVETAGSEKVTFKTPSIDFDEKLEVVPSRSHEVFEASSLENITESIAIVGTDGRAEMVPPNGSDLIESPSPEVLGNRSSVLPAPSIDPVEEGAELSLESQIVPTAIVETLSPGKSAFKTPSIDFEKKLEVIPPRNHELVEASSPENIAERIAIAEVGMAAMISPNGSDRIESLNPEVLGKRKRTDDLDTVPLELCLPLTEHVDDDRNEIMKMSCPARYCKTCSLFACACCPSACGCEGPRYGWFTCCAFYTGFAGFCCGPCGYHVCCHIGRKNIQCLGAYVVFLSLLKGSPATGATGSGPCICACICCPSMIK